MDPRHFLRWPAALLLAACSGGGSNSTAATDGSSGTVTGSTTAASTATTMSASGTATTTSGATASGTAGSSTHSGTAADTGTAGSSTGSGTAADTGTAGSSATGTGTTTGGTTGVGTAGSTGGGVPDPFGCEGESFVARVVLPNNMSATFTTLDAAFAAASTGSTIQICPGTYEVVDRTLDQSLTIQGSGEGVTVLTAAGKGRIFDVQAPTVIEDATLTGGVMSSGGAVRLVDSLTLRRITFTDNEATSHGGAIWAEHWAPNLDLVLEEVTFTDNVAKVAGGAIYLRGRIHAVGCTFLGNVVTNGSGGAIHASAYDAWDTSPSDRTLTDTVLHANSASSKGGALLLVESGTVTCTNCSLGFGQADDNTPDDVWASGSGAATDYGENIDFTCTLGGGGTVLCPNL